MKREQMIERLMAVDYADKATLIRLTNLDLRVAYDNTAELRERKRKLVLRADRRVHRQIQEAHNLQVSWERSCAWSAHWVHPKTKYPLRAPTDQELAALVIRQMEVKNES